MCIRDSRDAGQQERPERRAVVEEHLHTFLTERCIRHRKRCLLYTSDAADERSSVDLGGRRIIKKKKYQLTRRPTDLTIERSESLARIQIQNTDTTETSASHIDR